MSVHICLPVYMSVSAYLFSCASVNVHMCVWLCVSLWALLVTMYMYTYTCECEYTCIHLYICAYMCFCVWTYRQMCVYIC